MCPWWSVVRVGSANPFPEAGALRPWPGRCVIAVPPPARMLISVQIAPGIPALRAAARAAARAPPRRVRTMRTKRVRAFVPDPLPAFACFRTRGHAKPRETTPTPFLLISRREILMPRRGRGAPCRGCRDVNRGAERGRGSGSNLGAGPVPATPAASARLFQVSSRRFTAESKPANDPGHPPRGQLSGLPGRTEPYRIGSATLAALAAQAPPR